MDIYEYADAINAEIVFRRYPNQNGRFIAKFDHCDRMSEPRGGLIGEYGNGTDADSALADYVRNIAGKTIVFHAMSDTMRRELVVPASLTGPDFLTSRAAIRVRDVRGGIRAAMEPEVVACRHCGHIGLRIVTCDDGGSGSPCLHGICANCGIERSDRLGHDYDPLGQAMPRPSPVDEGRRDGPDPAGDTGELLQYPSDDLAEAPPAPPPRVGDPVLESLYERMMRTTTPPPAPPPPPPRPEPPVESHGDRIIDVGGD